MKGPNPNSSLGLQAFSIPPWYKSSNKSIGSSHTHCSLEKVTPLLALFHSACRVAPQDPLRRPPCVRGRTGRQTYHQEHSMGARGRTQMATVPVLFRYAVGLRRKLFRNVRLRGSWD